MFGPPARLEGMLVLKGLASCSQLTLELSKKEVNSIGLAALLSYFVLGCP
jgi:hypothetical protein